MKILVALGALRHLQVSEKNMASKHPGQAKEASAAGGQETGSTKDNISNKSEASGSVTPTEPATARTAGPSAGFKRDPPTWMEKPTDSESCPDGLQYIAGLDQLFVEQGIEYDKVIAQLGCESYYIIKNNRGERIYYAVESSMDCCKFLCGERRGFAINIYDKTGKAILKLKHRLACDFFCSPCCLQRLNVTHVSGGKQRFLGTVQQIWSPCFTKFVIKNSSKSVEYKMRSPTCACSCFWCCCCDCTCNAYVDFQITSVRLKTEIGRITRNLPVVDKNVIAVDATYCFGIGFPKDIEPEMKAVMIGAMFLIGLWFYEVQRNVMITMFE